MTRGEALDLAPANNRAIQSAELQRATANLHQAYADLDIKLADLIAEGEAIPLGGDVKS